MRGRTVRCNVFSIVLGLVSVGLLGCMGWYVWHVRDNVNKALSVASSASRSYIARPNPYAGWQTYTSPGGTYSVKYPAYWRVTCSSAAVVCNVGSSPQDAVLSPKAHPDWRVITLGHSKSALPPETWYMQTQTTPTQDCLYAPYSNAINGYHTYAAELQQSFGNPLCPSSPHPGVYHYGGNSSVGYTYSYVFAHNGQVVLLTMYAQDDGSGTENTIPLIPVFEQIAKSIAFHN